MYRSKHPLPVLAAVVSLSLSCSVLGLDDEAERPPTSVSLDGYQYTVSSTIRSDTSFSGDIAFSRIHAQLSVRNIHQVPISEVFGACPWYMRLYREGEWGSPVWDAKEVSEAEGDGLGCIAIAVGVPLDPGEAASPKLWKRSLTIPDLGNGAGLASWTSVEPGLYRVAAVLHPQASPADSKGEILAPQPIRITPGDLVVRDLEAEGSEP